MSEKGQREELSAWLDGELQVDSAQIEALLADDRMKEHWSRYHLIGDCLRNQLPERVYMSPVAPQALPHSSQLISMDWLPESELSPPAPRIWSSPRVRLAAAVSFAVALAAMMLLPMQANNTQVQLVDLAPLLPEDLLPEEFLEYPASVYRPGQASAASAEMERLSGYLINHSEYLTHMGLRGMLPYARLATYSGDRSMDNVE